MSNATDRRIDSLRPGRKVELSANNGYRVIAERSRDGKVGRIVRTSAAGFVVLSSWKW
jgi:hypothetical protein